MAKRIISIALLVLIAVVAWFAWSRRGVDSAMDSGAVVSHDSPSTDADKMNQGAVDLDGNPVGSSQSGTGISGSTSSTRNAHASTGQTGSTRMSVAASTGALQSMNSTPAPAGTPATDSLSENSPNGARFTGSGKFQWYRQGNLTWRIDTQNGAMCIAFATMEEWRKPIVYSHGCGNA